MIVKRNKKVEPTNYLRHVTFNSHKRFTFGVSIKYYVKRSLYRFGRSYSNR